MLLKVIHQKVCVVRRMLEGRGDLYAGDIQKKERESEREWAGG